MRPVLNLSPNNSVLKRPRVLTFYTISAMMYTDIARFGRMPMNLKENEMAKSHAAKVRRAERRRQANPLSIANPVMAQAMADIRRSGAAGSHQGGTRGTRTRQGAKQAAIRDSRGE